MRSALLVCNKPRGTAFYTDLLTTAGYTLLIPLSSCGEARRLLLERDFDLVLINGPLADEAGESLARHVAAKGLSPAILIVRGEDFEAVSASLEEDGVLTLGRPVSKQALWATLKLASSTHVRRRKAQAESDTLRKRVEDIRLVDRAKRILMTFLHLTEPEAHRYIEKQSMDLRVTKRAMAERIIKTYEND